MNQMAQVTEICLTVLGAKSLRSRCWQSHAPSEAPRQDPFQASLLAPDPSLGLWQRNYGLHLVLSLGACLCPNLLWDTTLLDLSY